MTAETANAGQIAFWNGKVGEMWTADWRHRDRMHAGLAAHAMAAAGFRPGERVIDIGCGCGTSTLEIAEAVAPRGAVTGIDISRPMLDIARERAGAPRAPAVAFIAADASVHRFPEAAADAVYSLFGVMFFENPETAFANFARALRPGGRLAFVCWRRFEVNEWIAVPYAAARAVADIPPPWRPGVPGPFALCDADSIRGLLRGAGLVDITIEAFDAPMFLGETAETALRKIARTSPISAGLAAVDSDRRSAVMDAVARSLTPFAGGDGVAMGGAAWMVAARR